MWGGDAGTRLAWFLGQVGRFCSWVADRELQFKGRSLLDVLVLFRCEADYAWMGGFSTSWEYLDEKEEKKCE